MNADNDIFTFLRAIPDIKECGVEHSAPCPFCGGTIKAIRSINNGHLLAKYDGCGRRVME